jgi:nitronate monooxygenase
MVRIMWPNRALLDLIGIELPIVQAPMAGANGTELTIAVATAGGLGSLPCAMLDPEGIDLAIAKIRAETDGPLNVNFFCHEPPPATPDRHSAWFERLDAYYRELDVDPDNPTPAAARAPFDHALCDVVERRRPEVVSFHFGLPDDRLVDRVKAAGSVVLSSATTVAEAEWLAAHGCDLIIAQGCEAGGHRGMFLTDEVATQPGTMALVPQIVDAVEVPVIAAGGIADGRGIAAAFALGAAGVQMGTAYLLTPESTISSLHRDALGDATEAATALTNLFSGRPARGLMNRLMREIGPMSVDAPPFPTAGGALAPLKARAEAAGNTHFSSLWAGQAARLCRSAPASDLTRTLASDALEHLGKLASATPQ